MTLLTYKFVWPSGYSAHMTTEQYEAACKIADRFGLPHTVTVQSPFGADDCIMINANGMWIGVEKDGYAHT